MIDGCAFDGGEGFVFGEGKKIRFEWMVKGLQELFEFEAQTPSPASSHHFFLFFFVHI